MIVDLRGREEEEEEAVEKVESSVAIEELMDGAVEGERERVLIAVAETVEDVRDMRALDAGVAREVVGRGGKGTPRSVTLSRLVACVADDEGTGTIGEAFLDDLALLATAEPKAAAAV